MTSIRSLADAGPHYELQSDTAACADRVAVLDDIRVAEEQVAHGEVVEHEDAKRRALARLRR